MKKLFPLILLGLISVPFFGESDFIYAKAETNEYTSVYNYELKSSGTYKITSIKDENLTDIEFRLYSFVEDSLVVDEILSDIFKNCSNVKNIMLSKDILTVSKTLFDGLNLNFVAYTGSLDEFESLNLNYDGVIKEYACDEGFINYWNLYVRPTAQSNICDITKETFNYVMDLYNSLSNRDYAIVNAYKDKQDTSIKDSIEYLKELFNEDKTTQKEDLPQNLTMGLVILIAVLGMTSIAIFYLLREKQIIK